MDTGLMYVLALLLHRIILSAAAAVGFGMEFGISVFF